MNFKEELSAVLAPFGLAPGNIGIYETALTHPSYANEHHVKSYQRLEFLGDAILGFLVAEAIFAHPGFDEGAMTKLRAQLVCQKANAKYTEQLGLIPLIKFGRGARRQTDSSEAVQADIFESFLGAVYLDHGSLAAVRAIIRVLVDPEVEALAAAPLIEDYKSALQEAIQAESRQAVVYQVVGKTGPAHDLRFTVEVSHLGIALGRGSGKSKKEAEQQAAAEALAKLAR